MCVCVCVCVFATVVFDIPQVRLNNVLGGHRSLGRHVSWSTCSLHSYKCLCRADSRRDGTEWPTYRLIDVVKPITGTINVQPLRCAPITPAEPKTASVRCTQHSDSSRTITKRDLVIAATNSSSSSSISDSSLFVCISSWRRVINRADKLRIFKPAKLCSDRRETGQ